MPGYREITIPSETRTPRGKAPARAVRGGGRAGGRSVGDLRSVLARVAGAAAASCRNSPGAVLASVVAVAAAGLVCFNALGHQSGRHPAPILPKVAQKTLRETAPPRESVAEAPREADAKPAAAAPRQAARDPIRDLIRADETTASVTPRAEPAKPVRVIKPAAVKAEKAPEKAPEKTAEKADAPVLRAQRALAKLGYAVKPDGAMGPGTRAAIETFERGAKLPVTGEAAGRTLRALVSRAAQG